jgi:hypothetical protein
MRGLRWGRTPRGSWGPAGSNRLRKNSGNGVAPAEELLLRAKALSFCRFYGPRPRGCPEVGPWLMFSPFQRFVVSHPSTMRPWMDGAPQILRPTAENRSASGGPRQRLPRALRGLRRRSFPGARAERGGRAIQEPQGHRLPERQSRRRSCISGRGCRCRGRSLR